jgi:histone-lysine N-methyltransferase SETD3
MLDENSKKKDLINNNNEIFNLHKDQDENEINQNLVKENEYISKDPIELSRFFKDEGNRFFLKKEYDVALIYFTKAIEYDPINKIFYSNRSACHLARGNYQMALKDAVKCTELDPTYVKGYYRAALAHYEMNQLETALNMINVYKEHGNEKDIQVLYSNILLRQKEQEEKKKKFSSFNNFMKFNNFLHESNIYFSKLEIEFYTDDHRGIVAKQDISKDEVILKVPKDMLISIELARTTTIGEQIATFMYIELNSPKHCLLTSYLLHEKALGKESKWLNYLDILPKDYSSFPIFYSEEELSFLEGSPFKNQILEKKEDIKKDYEKICDNIQEFNQYSFKEFCETRMAVSSRIFGIKIDYRKTDVLAPFADLLNHKRPRTTHWYYDEKYKSFIIQSLDNISKGSEVYILFLIHFK